MRSAPRHPAWRRSIAATTALVALVGACGDDDDDTADAPTSQPGSTSQQGAAEPDSSGGGTAPPATGEPIKLMVIDEKTAGVSPTAGIAEGAEAAAKQINDEGGIGGRPIEVSECDTKGDPNTAAECARTAVADGVVAIVGSVSQVASDFMPILEQNDIASIGNLPLGQSELTSPVSFPLTGGALELAGLGLAAANAGATKLAVAYVDIPQGAIFVEFVKLGLAGSGVEVTNLVPVPPGAPDMSTYAAAALEGGTDAVVTAMQGQDTVNLVTAVRQAEPDTVVAVSSNDVAAVRASLSDSLGAGANGVLQIDQTAEHLGGEGWQRYAAAMEAAGFDDIGGIYKPNSYASVLVLAEVARTLPEVTAAAVLGALPSVSGLDVGVMPPVQFTDGNKGQLPRIFNDCVVITEIRDGEASPVTGSFVHAVGGETCETS